MPGEDENKEGQEKESAGQGDSELATLRAQLAAQQATIEALTRASATGQGVPEPPRHEAPPPPSGGMIAGLSDDVVAFARSQGMSDAEIKANAPVIMPLVLGIIRQIAPGFLGQIEDVRSLHEETAALMEGEEGAFKHAKLLRAEIRAEKAAARKEGRPIDFQTAYNSAVAKNLQKVIAAETAQVTGGQGAGAGGLRARDASAQTINPARKAVGASQEAPDPSSISQEDFAALPPEKQEEIFKQYSNVPI